MNGQRLKRPLPSGWRWARLESVCSFESGRFLPSGQISSSGPIPVYGANGLLGYTVTACFREPCIVLGRVGSCGAVNATAGPAWITDNTIVCKPNESSEFGYVAAFLTSLDFDSLRAASVQPLITQRTLRSLEIPLPALDEQRRIAARLSEQMATVDRARQATEAELEAANALPAAFLRQVFESEEARTWPRRRLGEICQIAARQVNPTLPHYRNLPHVSGENIESGTCRLLAVRTAAEDRMVSGKYLFAPGDVLYSKIRPYLRKVAVVDFEGLCSADIYPLRPAHHLVDPRWLGWLLLSDSFSRYADDESRRVRMPKLNRRQLFPWEAPTPLLDVQGALMDKLNTRMAQAERLRRDAEAQLEAVNALPGALLAEVFGGFEPPS